MRRQRGEIIFSTLYIGYDQPTEPGHSLSLFLLLSSCSRPVKERSRSMFDKALRPLKSVEFSEEAEEVCRELIEARRAIEEADWMMYMADPVDDEWSEVGL